MANITVNATATALTTEERLLLLYCEVHRPNLFVYATAGPVWMLALSEWMWSVCGRHAESAVDLHRLMLFVPLVQVLHAACSIAYYAMCPVRRSASSLQPSKTALSAAPAAAKRLVACVLLCGVQLAGVLQLSREKSSPQMGPAFLVA